MANTKSAKKAARQAARRTIVNKSRRSRMRSAIRKVEEAIAAGDHSHALGAMAEVEPALIWQAVEEIVIVLSHKKVRDVRGIWRRGRIIIQNVQDGGVGRSRAGRNKVT